jgi:Transglutaminase-like superfamily
VNRGLQRRVAALRGLELPRARAVGRVAAAQWELVRARLSVAVTRRGRLLYPVTGTPSPVLDEAVRRARGVSRAIEWAATYGLFRPTCLVRAIALERMLKREGIGGASVRIGARRSSSRIEMHAWIDLGGTVLGDLPERAGTFTPLRDFTVLDGA